MPKKSPLPEYGNQQITALIKEYIHDARDRKMLYLHLVDGKTIGELAGMFNIGTKTVWTHLMDGKREIFSHLPAPPDENPCHFDEE